MFYIEIKILEKENKIIAKENTSSYDSTLAHTLADWMFLLHFRSKETVCKTHQQFLVQFLCLLKAPLFCSKLWLVWTTFTINRTQERKRDRDCKGEIQIETHTDHVWPECSQSWTGALVLRNSSQEMPFSPRDSFCLTYFWLKHWLILFWMLASSLSCICMQFVLKSSAPQWCINVSLTIGCGAALSKPKGRCEGFMRRPCNLQIWVPWLG